MALDGNMDGILSVQTGNMKKASTFTKGVLTRKLAVFCFTKDMLRTLIVPTKGHQLPQQFVGNFDA
jgi:hypothetical protein